MSTDRAITEARELIANGVPRQFLKGHHVSCPCDECRQLHVAYMRWWRSERKGRKSVSVPLDTLAELCDRAERAEAAIDRVRAIHRPIDAVTVIVLGGKNVTEKRCIHCHDAYPCPTLRALDGAQ